MYRPKCKYIFITWSFNFLVRGSSLYIPTRNKKSYDHTVGSEAVYWIRNCIFRWSNLPSRHFYAECQSEWFIPYKMLWKMSQGDCSKRWSNHEGKAESRPIPSPGSATWPSHWRNPISTTAFFPYIRSILWLCTLAVLCRYKLRKLWPSEILKPTERGGEQVLRKREVIRQRVWEDGGEDGEMQACALRLWYAGLMVFRACKICVAMFEDHAEEWFCGWIVWCFKVCEEVSR